MEAALALAGYFADMVTERRRARPTDDLTSALLDADLGRRPARPTTRSSPSSSSWWWPGNETTTKLLANAWYWAWRFPDQRAKAFADAGPGPRLGGGDPALRHVDADAAAGHHGRRRPAGDRAPRRRAGPAARRVGQPRRWTSSPTPTATTSTGTPPSSSASAAAAISAWAPPWPGSRPASVLEELVAPGGRLRHRRGGGRAGALHQRAGLRRLPPTSVTAL